MWIGSTTWKFGSKGGAIMTFESLGECLEYEKGVIVFEVNLPKKAATCQYCPMVKTEEFLKRFSCRITGEFLMAPFSRRGDCCPIQFKEETE